MQAPLISYSFPPLTILCFCTFSHYLSFTLVSVFLEDPIPPTANGLILQCLHLIGSGFCPKSVSPPVRLLLPWSSLRWASYSSLPYLSMGHKVEMTSSCLTVATLVIKHLGYQFSILIPSIIL